MRASDVFEPLGEADTARLLGWLEARYGLGPQIFAGHRFWQRPSAKTIWILAAAFEGPPGFSCEALGVMVMRKMPPAGKLTSTFLQRFGQSASKNTVHFEGARLATFLSRQPVPIAGPAMGYQIVFGDGRVLGAGFIKGGLLRSELPKAWTLAL